MHKIRAVIFDLDGLMADSEPLAEWSWNQVLERYGHRLDYETYCSVLGLRVVDSSRVICRRYELPITPAEAMAERDRVFLEAVPSCLQARVGLYPLLDELAARGLPLGVATSGHRRYVTLALETLGITDRFGAVATGDEVAQGKPAPDIYLLAAERLGVPPEHCLALDDAPPGVEAASAAGMVGVAVPNQHTASLEFLGAHRVLNSLDEVREGLDELLPACERDRVVRYVAAGGVVVRKSDGRVLVLRRPSRDEVRLPKGHVDPGETVEAAALREVREESGCDGLLIRADLGAQVVAFDVPVGRRVVRTERYFVMELADVGESPLAGEKQFEPVWLPWDRALAALTFEAEREWVRRARAKSLIEKS
ncbi:MAG TPA: NUDIX domain-containing protein [Chloroflexi bacterium]|nr:NUDIX domain-containing protein [Chloroflexota bacterium]